jgi:hypothetical protein
VSALLTLEAPARALVDEVTTPEYARLLGLPRTRTLEGDLARRALGARNWYAEYGKPFMAVRQVSITRLELDAVTLSGGATLTGAALAPRLRSGGAHAVLAVLVSAGPEVDAESVRLWADGRPDESFFLDRLGAALAEQLVHHAKVAFCRQAEPRGETVLPHLSPGCGGWDLADQGTLMSLVAAGAATVPVRLLPSGMLKPRSSLLAALGVTRRPVPSSVSDACRFCDLSPCAFRRVPHRGAA